MTLLLGTENTDINLCTQVCLTDAKPGDRKQIKQQENDVGNAAVFIRQNVMQSLTFSVSKKFWKRQSTKFTIFNNAKYFEVHSGPL